MTNDNFRRGEQIMTDNEPLLDGFLPYPCGGMTETEIGCRLSWHSAWADWQRELYGDPFAHLLGDYGASNAAKGE